MRNRILIIDTDVAFAKAVASNFIAFGNDAIAFYDAADAIDLLQNQPPDLIVLNSDMEYESTSFRDWLSANHVATDAGLILLCGDRPRKAAADIPHRPAYYLSTSGDMWTKLYAVATELLDRAAITSSPH